MADEKTKHTHHVSTFLEKLTDPNFRFNKIYLNMVYEKKAKMLRNSPILEDIILTLNTQDEFLYEDHFGIRLDGDFTQPKVILEDKADAGKTITLKRKYISTMGDPDLFYWQFDSDSLIPVYIDLKNPEMDPNWESFQHDEYPQDDMVNFLARQIGSSTYWYVIKDLMMKGKFQFLLDSFDKADVRIRKIIEDGISNLGELEDNSFIIATRPGFLRDINGFEKKGIPLAIHDIIQNCLKQKERNPDHNNVNEELKKDKDLLGMCRGYLPLNPAPETYDKKRSVMNLFFKKAEEYMRRRDNKMTAKDLYKIVESFSKVMVTKQVYEVPLLVEKIGEMLSFIARKGKPIINHNDDTTKLMEKKDIYLLLNPYVDFYASFFGSKSQKDFKGFQQQIIEARLKHGSTKTKMPAPIEKILKNLHEDYVHKPYDDDYNNSPVGLIKKQIMTHFAENKDMERIQVGAIKSYINMIEKKMDECHINRNFRVLAEIRLTDSYGEDDDKKSRRIRDVMKEFQGEVSDIIEYIVSMPEAFKKYYKRNPFVFKGENCASISCYDFITAARNSTHFLEDVIRTCRDLGRYDLNLIWKGLHEVDSKLMLNDKFLTDLIRLVKSAECRDEQEIIEVASLDVPGCEVVRRISSGGTKIAYEAMKYDDKVVVYKYGINRRIRVFMESKKLSLHNIMEGDNRASIFKIKHPNICTFNLHKNTQTSEEYGISEYCDGDLVELYKRERNFTDEEKIGFLKQILDGTAHVHERGIINSDIKPDNIFYNNTPKGITLLLADFGLSQTIERLNEGEDSFMSIGHVYIRAPELHESSENKGLHCDVWSLGCLTYWMWKEEYPFVLKDARKPDTPGPERDEYEANMYSLKMDEDFKKRLIEGLEGVMPDSLIRIVEKCWQKPEERYKNAIEVQDDVIKHFD